MELAAGPGHDHGARSGAGSRLAESGVFGGLSRAGVVRELPEIPPPPLGVGSWGKGSRQGRGEVGCVGEEGLRWAVTKMREGPYAKSALWRGLWEWGGPWRGRVVEIRGLFLKRTPRGAVGVGLGGVWRWGLRTVCCSRTPPRRLPNAKCPPGSAGALRERTPDFETPLSRALPEIARLPAFGGFIERQRACRGARPWGGCGALSGQRSCRLRPSSPFARPAPSSGSFRSPPALLGRGASADPARAHELRNEMTPSPSDWRPTSNRLASRGAVGHVGDRGGTESGEIRRTSDSCAALISLRNSWVQARGS